MNNKQYLDITNDTETKAVLTKILDALYHAVCASGGDGDAIWYSRFYDVQQIAELVKEYNIQLNHPWDIGDFKDKTISWGHDQEWVTITNDKGIFNTAPGWVEFKIQY